MKGTHGRIQDPGPPSPPMATGRSLIHPLSHFTPQPSVWSYLWLLSSCSLGSSHISLFMGPYTCQACAGHRTFASAGADARHAVALGTDSQDSARMPLPWPPYLKQWGRGNDPASCHSFLQSTHGHLITYTLISWHICLSQMDCQLHEG